MRNFFSKVKYNCYRFLVWCAGANPDILENTARFSDHFVCGRSEQIKHAWTGALVLIPSTLAFCGMLYAAATLDISQTAVFTISFIWATVIFILERYIVSSFRKSHSVLRDLLSVTFIVRLLFSIGVGFTIADPLIHGVFKESIEKKLSEMNESEIDTIRNDARILTIEQDSIITVLNNRKTEIGKELKAKDELIAQSDNSLTNEIDGRVGSGKVGDGPSAAEKRGIRNRMLNERQVLYLNDSIAKSVIDSSIAKVEEVKSKIEGNKEQKIKDKKFSNDYLARRHALATASQDPKNSDIWWVRLFLTIFLIFIDVCCILYKAATTKGSYDDHINYEEYLSDIEKRVLSIDKKIEENDAKTHLKATKNFNETEGKQILINSSRVKQQLKANRESVLAIYESEKKFNQRMTDEHIRFAKFISKRRIEIKNIEDEEIKINEKQVLDRMIKEFYSKATQAFTEHSKL